MNMQTAIVTCFKKYATFSGRASRSEYWYWVLFIGLATIAIQSLDIAIFHIDYHNKDAFYPLRSIFSLVVLLPHFAVAARRLHDTNKSGWWQLIYLIPLIGFILMIIWLCRKSDQGDNRFGAPPLS